MELIAGFLTPSAVGAFIRYFATAAFTAMSTKLGFDAAYVPAIAAGLAAAGTGIYGWSQSTPKALAHRAAKANG